MKVRKMRGTGKSEKPKPKPLEDAEQYKRFVETAKKIEVDESGASFEKAFESITLPLRRKGIVKTSI